MQPVSTLGHVQLLACSVGKSVTPFTCHLLRRSDQDGLPSASQKSVVVRVVRRVGTLPMQQGCNTLLTLPHSQLIQTQHSAVAPSIPTKQGSLEDLAQRPVQGRAPLTKANSHHSPCKPTWQELPHVHPTHSAVGSCSDLSPPASHSRRCDSMGRVRTSSLILLVTCEQARATCDACSAPHHHTTNILQAQNLPAAAGSS